MVADLFIAEWTSLAAYQTLSSKIYIVKKIKLKKYLSACSIISHYWDGTNCWNLSSWMQGTLYLTVNAKAATDLQMQEPGDHFTTETVSSLFAI